MSGIRKRVVQFPNASDSSRLSVLSREAVLFDEMRTAVRAVTATTTATEDDHVILADPTAGPIVINLLAAAAVPGREYIIKRSTVAGNTVTIDASGTETIDNLLTRVLGAGTLDSITIKSDGAAWWIV